MLHLLAVCCLWSPAAARDEAGCGNQGPTCSSLLLSAPACWAALQSRVACDALTEHLWISASLAFNASYRHRELL